MKNDNVKSKIIFLLLGTLVLAGCANNFDMRQQAKENRMRGGENISSRQSAVNFPVEAAKTANIKDKEPVKILFVGDMMFDRHIREAVEKYGDGNYNYILEPIKEKLAEYNFVVGNLEGPVTDRESVSVNTKIGEGKNFIFTFDPAVAKVLAENNIKLVNLGNNHISNQGEKGIEQTKKYLEDENVRFFGETGYDESSTLVMNIGKIQIGFVSYNYSVSDSVEAAVENIKAAKEQSDFVIVCSHWGTEYKIGDPGEAVRALARRFVDAGADAVIGGHPHVVQSSEEYGGKKVYYSLGNFVFDQYFQKETMEGMGVELTIGPGGAMEYYELNFVMNKRGQTEMSNEQ